ncbi:MULTISPECIES: hypothetical protein [Shewanella]|uniref:Uncharacterized protein n=1 Tax=Shewanella indica TaxID=768528 RepID=A0ABU4Q6M0_9GAMM|nr:MULTISPECIES: hypothetical protein [Shewanella]MDX6015087.1 hypothetical protein [Shewanella indica]NDO74761.1 hypothetical protein [Shewanella sp. SE1]
MKTISQRSSFDKGNKTLIWFIFEVELTGFETQSDTTLSRWNSGYHSFQPKVPKLVLAELPATV